MNQDSNEQQTFIATPGTPGRYSLATVATLGACLRQTKRVRPTPVLYLYVGAQGWVESEQAIDLVNKSRSRITLDWDAYLDNGSGADPRGIYLFGADGQAYRGFDIE